MLRFRRSHHVAARSLAKSILDSADAGYRKCFAARAKGEAFFAAIMKQAQELADRMR